MRADRRWAGVVSGLALGVDGAAHEGALQGAEPGALATIALVAESDMVAVVSERAIELPERWKMLKRLPLLLDRDRDRLGDALFALRLEDVVSERLRRETIAAHDGEELASGDLDGAAHALGKRYAIAGKVVRGKQLGRKLGYPTANIRLAGKRPALSGIYATWVHGIGPEPRASVSSLGTRPTVQGVEPLLEAHVFDFEGDLYGRRLEVEFVAKLRDEEKFDDLPALVRQMDLDSEQARRVLRHDSEKSGVMA